MSPRAAWQLEALGFAEAYDYAEGKIDWIAHGLPMEGRGPHYAVAGEVADREAVLACRVGDLVGDLSYELDTVPHDYCVVLNDQDIVLGRMRKKNVQGPADVPVELVMEAGPTTLRPNEPAEELLQRILAPLFLLGSMEFVGSNERNGWKLAGTLVPAAYVGWSLWLVGWGSFF